MPFDVDAEAAEIRAMPLCLTCGGCGYVACGVEMDFSRPCACRWPLFDPGCGECHGTGQDYDGLTCRCRGMTQ